VKHVAAIGISLFLAACQRDTGGGSTPSWTTSSSTTSATIVMTPNASAGEYKLTNDGGQIIEVGGLVVETTPDLPDCSSSSTVNVGGNDQIVLVIDTWPILLKEGQIQVAGRDFGAAPRGCRVRLAKDGVHVDGELRGPLP